MCAGFRRTYCWKDWKLVNNKFGKKSELHVKAVQEHGKTRLEDCCFTAPFKVMSPFYDEQNRMSLMLISVSAGIMEGDTQDIRIEAEPGTWMEIISQSYEKIHKMTPGGATRRRTTLKVAREATLLYMPLPAIPFAESAFENETEIYLEDDTSRLFYGEIISCGRAARGERFAYRRYKSRTKIRQGEQLIYLDNALYEPEQQELEGFCMFEGYSHLSSLLIINVKVSVQQEEELLRILEETERIEGGYTRTGHGDLCVRMLANEADVLVKMHKRIKEIF